MSTIKSSSDHLTINADGSGKDIKFQANGVEKASISSAGAFTSTTIDATKLTGNLPAIDGGSLTNLPAGGVDGITSSADATAITIDSNENVGIGVVPDTGFGGCSALDIGSVGGLFYEANYGGLHEAWNVYTNGGATYKYKTTSYATDYEQINGTHKFKVAGNGSADAAITWTTAMTIDNNGAVTMPYQPAFSVNLSANQLNLAIYGRRTIEFNTERYDQNSDFNTGTYKFTAPVTGKYQLNFSLEFQQSDGSANWYGGHIETSNKLYFYYNLSKKNGDASDGLAMSCLADMDAGDTAFVSVYQHGGTAQTDVYTSSSFNGFLAC
jgi:hypothetical protein